MGYERIEEGRSYRLENGTILPWTAFGTGVVWQYSRNKPLMIKKVSHWFLSSAKHLKLNHQLKINLFAKRILRQAYTEGYRFFDSGRIYGYSEKRLGETVASKPDVKLSTKCSAMDITRAGSPDTVAGNLKVSLGYLGVEKVDLYLLHWPEGDWLNYYQQIVDQYKAGHCKAFGACNLKVEHIEKIMEANLPLPMVVQTELNPLNSKPDLRKMCEEHGILMMAYGPAAHNNPMFRDAPSVRAMREKYKKTAVQIALRWHYQNHVIPLVSPSSREHMRENLDIFDFALTPEEMEEIEALDCGMAMIKTQGIDDPNYIYNL